MNITEKDVKLIGSVSDEDGDSAISFYLIPQLDAEGNRNFKSRREVLDWLEEYLPARSCSCIHDCCAHWFTRAATIVGAHRGSYIVAQWKGRNV